MRLGLISDTHGLLRPEAIDFLRGSDHLVHAGDIGTPEVLAALRAIAPLTVVRGNNDRAPWADDIGATEMVELAGVWFYVIHDLADLDLDPVAAGVRLVVSGHSHKPVIEQRGGVLYANPGSAGPRRFKLPVTCAEVVVSDAGVSARIVPLM